MISSQFRANVGFQNHVPPVAFVMANATPDAATARQSGLPLVRRTSTPERGTRVPRRREAGTRLASKSFSCQQAVPMLVSPTPFASLASHMRRVPAPRLMPMCEAILPSGPAGPAAS